jgi:hypothetical protein
MRQLLGDDQTDDPSDMVGMELGILAPVKTNPSYICLEELRKTNPIFTVSNLQLQCGCTNINYNNIILLTKMVAVAVWELCKQYLYANFTFIYCIFTVQMRVNMGYEFWAYPLAHIFLTYVKLVDSVNHLTLIDVFKNPTCRQLWKCSHKRNAH